MNQAPTDRELEESRELAELYNTWQERETTPAERFADLVIACFLSAIGGFAVGEYIMRRFFE